MKKARSLALALCMLALALSACGTQPQQPQDDTPPAEAKRVEPLPADEGLSNPSDATLAASFLPSGIREEDGKLVMDLTVYDYELFDSVDVSNLAEGDTLVVNGKDLTVTSREVSDDGLITINGGLETGGVWLAPGDGGTYYTIGMDDIKDYHEVASVTLPVDPNCILTDNSDLDHPDQQLSITEVQKISDEDAHFVPYNTQVLVEGGTVTAITRSYMP